MFMGEYEHSIDNKGRVIIPAKFREQLGDTFVLTKGLDGCLFIYTNEDWAAFAEKLKNTSFGSEKSRKLQRYFMAGAVQVEADKQGRILIPGKLRDLAGLTKDVSLLGVGNRIELWNTETWENDGGYDDANEIAEILEGLWD
ncbi:MAG: division/cell wall cluster transcriptional repressor MraZ [Lachnospiraceae bacterium]|nr:division/cell wall cluster transcriptional repressor MraZ [Lachnospiraceae bacterium]